MNYGEQRFRENMRELTPEEKAKQFLAIEALKEQTRYEREKRRQLAEKVKGAGQGLLHILILFLLSMILVFTVGCEKPQECITVDLGKAGEPYEVIMNGPGGDGQSGYEGRVYVDGDRIKQDICF